MKSKVEFHNTETTFGALDKGDWFIFCNDSEKIPCLKFNNTRYFDTQNNTCAEKNTDDTEPVLPLDYDQIILNRIIEFYQLNNGDLFLYHEYDDYGEEISCSVCIKLNKDHFYNFTRDKIQEMKDDNEEIETIDQNSENNIVRFYPREEHY